MFLINTHCFSISLRQNIPFSVNIDFSQFRHKGDRNYLELYYSFNETAITYHKTDHELGGAVVLHISILSTANDSLVAAHSWRIPHEVIDTTDLDPTKNIVGVIGLSIPNGHHILKVKSFDENDPSLTDIISHTLSPKFFSTESVALSDIELCSSIRKIPKDPNNIFYKNTYEVIPNPSGFYSTDGTEQPKLYYYLETYNWLSTTQDTTYDTKAAIYDSKNREVIVREHSKRRVHESSVEVGFINTSSLSTGSHTLIFSVIDPTTEMTVSVAKKFFVYDPHEPPVDNYLSGANDYSPTEYDFMDEEELDKELAVIGYIASNTKKSQYNRLSSPDAKRRFLNEFWKRYDPDSQTGVNELKQEYMRRFRYTNSHFSSGQKEGWKSDRGRVLILYGHPDEYERYPSGVDTKPYEIWYYYNLQGGVYFVFVDRTGFSDYILVHSTYRGELRDVNWISQIRDN